MRYIYLDESFFGDKKECVAYGAFVTDSEISSEIIKTALENLRNDPDRNKQPQKSMDDKTLQRGYFHASKDSSNAHSHLCYAINNNISGAFSCNYFDPTLMIGKEKEQNYLLNLNAKLTSMDAFQTDEKVILYFENRKDLSIGLLNKLISQLENELLMSIYDNPSLQTYFPEIELKIIDKTNPGLQIIDFILWSVNRNINGDNTWYNRIKSNFKTNFSNESKSWGGDNFHIKEKLSIPVSYYKVGEYPKNADSLVDNDLIVKMYLNAEYVVNFYMIKELPKNSLHFKNEIYETCKGTLDIAAKDHIEKVARLFLKLFDMIPLINTTTSAKDRQFLLLSKKYISLLLRRDHINGVRTWMYLHQVRSNILKLNPRLLTFT